MQLLQKSLLDDVVNVRKCWLKLVLFIDDAVFGEVVGAEEGQDFLRRF